MVEKHLSYKPHAEEYCVGFSLFVQIRVYSYNRVKRGTYREILQLIVYCALEGISNLGSD